MNVGGGMNVAARTNNGARDFDFWLGRWKVRNRYLRGRLEGSSDWVEFEATSVARLLLHRGLWYIMTSFILCSSA